MILLPSSYFAASIQCLEQGPQRLNLYNPPPPPAACVCVCVCVCVCLDNVLAKSRTRQGRARERASQPASQRQDVTDDAKAGHTIMTPSVMYRVQQQYREYTMEAGKKKMHCAADSARMYTCVCVCVCVCRYV